MSHPPVSGSETTARAEPLARGEPLARAALRGTSNAAAADKEARPRLLADPFSPADPDKFREECGVFGVFGVKSAARFVALGLHALQHRGQEAAGVVSVSTDEPRFSVVRRHGLVRDNFTDAATLGHLPGPMALGHTRYSTAGAKGRTETRDIQPLYAELTDGGVAIAHNGNLTNAAALRRELVGRGSIFQSGSDTECIIHLMARSIQIGAADKLEDALRRVEGAFSIVAMTADAMIGVRDPLGVRPLVIGRLPGDGAAERGSDAGAPQGPGEGWVLASETVALDIIDAQLVREVVPGEMVTIDAGGLRSEFPFKPQASRFCVFEYVYFSRPDSEVGGQSVYEVRRRIGEELAREAPVAADLVCPIPDSGTPAALGFAQASGLPFVQAVIKNQYVGRTFIEPLEHIRNMGVRLKLNVIRSMVEGKRVVLVDDSVVRGTTARKIKDMILDAGAKEIHFRVASPPTAWPCFYGVDTPMRGDLLAARLGAEEMRDALGATSLAFVSLDGLYRACGVAAGRDAAAPRFCDACFSGQYPIAPSDQIAAGAINLSAAE